MPVPTEVTASADQDVDVHAGAWSYFGDPRSIAHGTRIFTGCVGTNRGIVVDQYDLGTGESFHMFVHRNHEVDDHDNPSLAHNFRPIIPRDLTDPSTLVVFYLHGTARSCRSFRRVIRMNLGTVPAD